MDTNASISGMRKSKYTLVQQRIHRILEKPEGQDFAYHAAVFTILGASSLISVLQTIDGFAHSTLVMSVIDKFETFITALFCLQYSLHVWSSGSNGKFKGWKGKMKYLTQIHMIFDLLIILSLMASMVSDQLAQMRIIQVIRCARVLRIDKFVGGVEKMRRITYEFRMELMC